HPPRSPRHLACPFFPYATLFGSGVFERDSSRPSFANRRPAAGTVSVTDLLRDQKLVLNTDAKTARICLIGQEMWLLTGEASSGRHRKSTRLNSSHRTISYAVFCL